tara:strand:+ start:135 stop:287 length:153 start_codon:yes stop_codon:yes gene_type:complete
MDMSARFCATWYAAVSSSRAMLFFSARSSAYTWVKVRVKVRVKVGVRMTG